MKDEISDKIILSCLVIGILAIIIFVPIIKTIHDDIKIYSQAEQLIASESYGEALFKLKKLENKKFKDTQALISLCNSHIYYLDGSVAEAYSDMENVSFRFQNEEQLKRINDYKEMLDLKYNEYLERKELEEYRYRVKHGVPFVGMKEEDIANTSLGKPSDEVHHDATFINGYLQPGNTYNFKSGSKIVYIVKCAKGEVKEVRDLRWYESSTSSRVTPTPKPKTSSSPNRYKRKSESSYKSDPYNAKDYTTAEDFYDDNCDEFDSLDDAEDYFDEYGD